MTTVSIVLVLSLTLLGPAGYAQPPVHDSAASEGVAKRVTLHDIVLGIAQLERDLAARQDELRSPRAEGRKEEVTQQIQAIGIKLRTLRDQFTEVATGIDLQAFVKPRDEKTFDWQQRLLELVEPILNELGRLTARPREMDQLRTTIARYQEQRRLIDQALANIRTLTEPAPDPVLEPHLTKLQQDWAQRSKELNTQERIASQQLEQRLGEQTSVAESVQNLFQLFFRSRGRNVLLAGGAFALFWLVWHWLFRLIQRWSPLHRRGATFAVRLFDIIYTACTVLGAVLAALAVLYLLGDWVLLTLAFFFLLGLAWTSRTMVPKFWGEAMLMLNLGPMREGERVIYQGLPWQVRSLNFYTRLVNPELTGGDIRLPLHDCLALRSRSCSENEVWFPTRTGDWVVFGEDTLARVVLQTPEIVRVVFLGGSQQTFTTPAFLEQHPTVLSTGFRLSVQFGVDYQHQALVTHEIPAQLTMRLQEGLQPIVSERELVHLAVEFAEAGDSALNMRVLADFAGSAASRWLMLRRAIQRLCVEACNDYDWVIPFAQMTLHLATQAATNVPRLLEETASTAGRETEA
jgi:hypothetical protein